MGKDALKFKTINTTQPFESIGSKKGRFPFKSINELTRGGEYIPSD
jgi:hypothetical protein